MNPSDVQARLAALEAEYARELPAKLAALRATLARARDAAMREAALAEADHLAHRLAGSAGSYGLHAVSDAMRKLGVAIRRAIAGEDAWAEIETAMHEAEAMAP